jgi:C2 domain
VVNGKHTTTRLVYAYDAIIAAQMVTSTTQIGLFECETKCNGRPTDSCTRSAIAKPLKTCFMLCSTSAQSSSGRMSVTINEARDIPTKDRGGAQYAQVHVLLLPNRTNRHRTKIRPTGDEDNPQFDETFVFKLPTG